MPPPRHAWGPGDPNRDYQLLAGDDAEAQQRDGRAKQVAAGRLFRLAREEAWTLALASLVLLVASVGQVAFPKLAGGPDRCGHPAAGGRQRRGGEAHHQPHPLRGPQHLGGPARCLPLLPLGRTWHWRSQRAAAPIAALTSGRAV